ncbi:hypothetical protein GE09DRAFT_107285 [Coniochaeta sp. 2T2.1]|nr:hypothetical protein GE09DRAFT_107285 [Coniochaeta sp. 2T2.1]
MLLISLAVTYLLLVRLLRYRRRDRTTATYRTQPLSSMTLADAHTIQHDVATLEFPTTFSIAVFFALFKTYGIPSVSSLLYRTTQLLSPSTASKRAADTGVLLTEAVLNPPSSRRASQAIDRINALHVPYRKTGVTSDENMLYTLSLFALEPGRWVEKWECRALSEVERCALGVFWRDMGHKLGVKMDEIGEGWEETDGLMWMEMLERWSKGYEERYMRPAETNERVARATVGVALVNVPRWMKRLATQVVGVLLEEKLRVAVRFDEPGRGIVWLVLVALGVRRLVVRWLCPSRAGWLRVRWFTEERDRETGRYHALRYVAHPWYVKPSLWLRWGLGAVCLRLFGGFVPGDGKYHPEGYLIWEVGPKGMKGKGRERYR